MFDGIYGINMTEIGAAFSNDPADRTFWAELPDEVKEQVNSHADEFHSAEDIKAFIKRLEIKS